MDVNSRATRWTVRRMVRLLAILVLAVVSLVSVWVLGFLWPRHAHFTERHGTLVSAEVVEESGNEDAATTGVRHATVRVTADTGLTVQFRVLRPADTETPLPLAVLVGGHRTGRHAVALVGDPGPVVVAALDYPYDGPEKIRSTRQGLAALPKIQRALLDTPPAISLALDWLVAQPWVDSQRVELVGVSLGTPFATVAGALDTRFRRVWLIHGGANQRAWLDRTLAGKIENDFVRGAAARSLHLLAHGASFAPEDWMGRIAPRPVVIIGAREDESLTRENVEALYAAAGEPRRLIWTDGGHVLPKRPEVVQQLLAIVLAEMN